MSINIKMSVKKIKSIFIVIIIYIFAFFLCRLLYPILPFSSSAEGILLKLIILSLLVSIYIFIVSTVFKIYALHRLCWNLIPFIVSIEFMLLVDNLNFFSGLLVGLISIWSLGLLVNWLINFQDFNQKDWYYLYIKSKFTKSYQLINLLFIHILPTMVGLIAILPALYFIGDVMHSSYEPSLMTIIGYLIVLTAIIFENIANLQLFVYKPSFDNKSRFIMQGMWKNSRHPNYFCECLFWFGIFLTYFSFQNANAILIFAPLLVFLLIEMVLIPLFDSYQLSLNQNYQKYIEDTNPMFPLLIKNKEKS